MDLYNELINEILISDVSTKGWKEFEAKYSGQIGRRDLFIQFTKYAGNTDDKRLVGALAGKDSEPGQYTSYGKEKIENKRAQPDMTLWTAPNHKDPSAIYTYPLEFVINHPGSIPYGFNSRFLRVIKLRSSAKALYLQELNTQAAKAILRSMDAFPPTEVMSEEDFWENLVDLIKAKVAPHPVTVPKMFFLAVQSLFDFAKTSTGKRLIIKGTLSSSVQTRRFLKAGYTVVVDTAKGPEQAVVHPNEPEQAFFMRPDAFDIVDVFEVGQKKGNEYDNTVWNFQRGAKQIMARVINSIDPKDQIVKIEQLIGGTESFSDPLKAHGVVDLSMSQVAITKRGRAVSVNLKSFSPDHKEAVPRHRQGDKHIEAKAHIAAWTEGGAVKHTLDREQSLDQGAHEIAKQSRASEVRQEWRPVRGINEQDAIWRRALMEVSKLTHNHYDPSTVDIDKALEQAPMVVANIKSLMATVGWHMDMPEGKGGDWNMITAWMAVSGFYILMNQTNGVQDYGKGMKKAIDIRDKFRSGNVNSAFKYRDLDALKGTKIYDAAHCIMAGTGDGNFREGKDYIANMMNGMEHLFSKRYIVMAEGAYQNFSTAIHKELFTLVENCQPEEYEKILKKRWDDIREESDDNAQTAYRFTIRTGEQPRHAWLQMSEALDDRYQDLDRDVVFRIKKKSPNDHSPKMAAARRSIEKAVKRTLIWSTDHATGSCTAYIGHGRKIRLGDGSVSAGPMVTPFDVNRMPGDQALSALLVK